MLDLPINSPQLIDVIMSPDSKSPEYLKLAYDIRHPLTNISLAIEMLEEAKEDNQIKMCIEIIKRNVSRIDEITNELIKEPK